MGSTCQERLWAGAGTRTWRRKDNFQKAQEQSTGNGTFPSFTPSLLLRASVSPSLQLVSPPNSPSGDMFVKSPSPVDPQQVLTSSHVGAVKETCSNENPQQHTLGGSPTGPLSKPFRDTPETSQGCLHK